MKDYARGTTYWLIQQRDEFELCRNVTSVFGDGVDGVDAMPPRRRWRRDDRPYAAVS